jgi:hypothetical protein
MGFLDKIFGSSKRKDDESFEEYYESLSPLERFVYNFTQNNGKFLIAKSKDEIIHLLQLILTDEEKTQYWAYDESLIGDFSGNIPLNDSKFPSEDDILVSYAHFLVENDGGLMFTNLETGDYRLIDLPATMVFLASPNQLVENKEKGMELINRRFHKGIRVQTISGFEKDDTDHSRTVYLILLV